MRHYLHYLAISLCTLGAFASHDAMARCTKSSILQTSDSRAAKIIFGNVNLPSKHLLPVGSLIDSKIVPPTAYTYGGANAESILWTCDKSDLSQIYFLAATNGDDRVGGFWDLGAPDGLQNVFATWFSYVGLQQRMDDVVLSRYWQPIPIKNYDEENGKIIIRLKHLPHLEARIYRISTLPPRSGSPSSFCGSGNLPLTGAYTCGQPSAYIQLSGSDSVSFAFSRDLIGEDGAYNFDFWGANNGIGYGLNSTTNYLSTKPACAIRNHTPLVMLETANIEDIKQNRTQSSTFQVEIECENLVASGGNRGQTAIAFQPSPNGYQQALQLGLNNSAQSVSHLLSDEYGQNANLAKGVGIEISNAATKERMWLQSPDAITGGGKNAGWYPVLEGKPVKKGQTVPDHAMYTQYYNAQLKALPGQQIEPGKIKATATIVVKVQ